MTTAIIIGAIFFISGIIIMVAGCFTDMQDGLFFGGIVTTVVSFIAMVCLLLINDRKEKNTWEQTEEYPVSEYTFKIKVVEFEQQKDTILVVIPKEK